MSFRAAAELSLGQQPPPSTHDAVTSMHLASNRAGSLPPVTKFRDALQGSLEAYGGLGGPLRSARERHPAGRGKCSCPLPKLPCCTPRDTVDVLGMEMGNAEPPTAWAGPVKPPPRDPAHARPAPRKRQQPQAAAPAPQGVAANGREAQRAYNSIDLDISQQLEARLKGLVEKHEQIPVEEATGIYVVLERCHSCEVHHGLTTRHDEQQYAGLAQEMLSIFRYGTRQVVLDAEEMLCNLDSAPRNLGCSYELGCAIWHNASRVGAFEVYLLTPSPAPQVSEGVIRFPLDPSVQRPLGSARSGSGSGHRTWGAQLPLPGGYNATLLHSKLSSKGWPNEKQILRRLFDSVPLGTVTVRVFSSSGLLLPSFSVEVQETAVAPSRKGVSGPVRFTGEGRQGICQLEDVPLQTGLEIRLSHPTMKTQVLKVTTNRLRVGYTLCTDIVFGLWTLDVPGGLAVYASTHDCHPSRIPDGARPFEGQVHMESGEMVPVKGGLHLPWAGFKPDSVQPAAPFSELERLEVHGYHSAEIERGVKQISMLSLHRQDRLEIAMLASPEVLLQVVFPECQRPLAKVQLQVERELQHTTTDADGQCLMVLRPGKHTVRLMHDCLTGGWVEQQLVIDSMSPKFMIPLPINVCVWRAHITVRGELRACELWATTAGSAPGSDDWEPFDGPLQSATGSHLEAAGGIVQLERYPVVPLSEQPPPVKAVSPLARVSLAPPFIQRIVETPSEEDGESWRDWCPRLMGSLPVALPLVYGDTAVPPSALVVRSETCCCGFGVAGIQVSVDDGCIENTTGSDGKCVISDLPPGDRCLTLSHPSLPGGSLKYVAVRPAGAGGPLELPLMLDSQLFLYVLDEAAGRQVLYASASSTSIPRYAKPFMGRLLNCGRDLKPSLTQRQGIQPFVLEVSSLPPGTPCPLSTLHVEPNAPGFQWCPVEPFPLTGCECGMQRLAQEGPIRLGALKPYATVTHVNGTVLNLPVEDFPKVSHVVKHLMAHFGLPEQRDDHGPDSVTLAINSQILQEDDDVLAGSEMTVLARLSIRVSFGHTHVGLSGVLVDMDGVIGTSSDRAKQVFSDCQKCLTCSDGTCELFAPTGCHTIVLTHELLDGHQSLEITLQELHATLTVAARARVFASMAAPPADASPAAASSVWLTTEIGQLEAGSLPVAGTMTLHLVDGVGRATEKLSEVTLKRDSFEAVPLEQMYDSCTVSLTKGVAKTDPAWSEVPVAGLSLQCSFGDCLWCPSVEGLMLTESSSWKRLLEGPICAGYLKPPVSARCHGLGEPVPMVTLPAETCSLVGDLCAALTKSSYKHPSEAEPLQLLPFLGERLLAADDAVPVRAVIDIWPPAKIHVLVQTGCCCRGVPDVLIHVNEEHFMDGTRSSASLQHVVKRGTRVGDAKGCSAVVTAVDAEEDAPRCSVAYEDGTVGRVLQSELVVRDPRHFGTTGADGSCCFVTNAGEHHMYLAHPLLGSKSDSATNQLTSKTQACVSMPRELHYLTDIVFHVYATSVQPQSSPDDRLQETQVWMCLHANDIPADAESVTGSLAIPGPRHVKIAGLQAVELPTELWEHEKGMRCPLRDLDFEIDPTDETVWCATKSLPSAERESVAAVSSCLHLALLSGPILIGMLRPAVLISVAGRDSLLRLPAAAFDTVGAIRAHLEGELSMPAAELGVFGEGTYRSWDDSSQVFPGQRLSVAQIAPLTISVVVPDGVGADAGQAEALSEVAVEIDGEHFGATDKNGMCVMTARVGVRQVHLVHACFGKEGRVLRDVTIEASQANDRVVLADIRVFCYATDPELDEEPADVSDEEPPGALPTLVWVCACREQVPQSALGIDGVVCSSSIHGGTASITISSDDICDCVLLSGALVEAGVDTDCSTAEKAGPMDVLSSLTLDFSRQGFMWRPKDPLPLSERQEELGGCEYIRLLDCPVAVGYLDPVLKVHKEEGPTIDLAVDRHRTVADVKAAVGEQLNIPMDEIEVFDGKLQLADAAWTKPGMELEVMEIAEVSLEVITSCCGDALADAAVAVNGVAMGVSDDEGMCKFVTTVGTHVVSLQHSACGKASTSCEITVCRGEANRVQLPVNIPISVYVTDPDPEEEEEEEEDRPLYDPSCVWVAADPSHIPDDARPLDGCLRCSHESVKADETEMELAPFEVEPMTFRFQPGGSRRAKCPMGCLELQNCHRTGFKWCPKDPSPLLERTEELDGCELLRLMACPMALGFMKPTVNVYCADDSHFVLPLESHGEVEVLQAFIAEKLGKPLEDLSFTTIDFREIQGPHLRMSSNILCAPKGQALKTAYVSFQKRSSAAFRDEAL